MEHALAYSGVEAGGIGVGGAIGYANGGWDGALMGAQFGQMAGSLAANFAIACFTAGTLATHQKSTIQSRTS